MHEGLSARKAIIHLRLIEKITNCNRGKKFQFLIAGITISHESLCAINQSLYFFKVSETWEKSAIVRKVVITDIIVFLMRARARQFQFSCGAVKGKGEKARKKGKNTWTRPRGGCVGYTCTHRRVLNDNIIHAVSLIPSAFGKRGRRGEENKRVYVYVLRQSRGPCSLARGNVANLTRRVAVRARKQ